MKRISQMLLALVVITSFASLASAGENSQHMQRRNVRQHERIQEGVRGGSLTPGEARHLRTDERKIHRTERHAKADGQLSVRERAHINRMQNHASRRIYRLKHNRRSA